MPRDRDRFRVELDVNAAAGAGGKAEPRATAAQRPEAAPFRIALLGDFSGRANRGDLETVRAGGGAARRPIRVDRDTLDDAIARLRPSLELALPVSHPPIELRFSSLEDFHPDRLFERLAPLRTRHERGLPSETAAPPTGGTHQLTRPLSPGALLDAILDATPLPPGGATIARTPVAELSSLSADDEATAAEMRALLHHPDFQALESLWRGVDFLARRLETGPALQLYLIDLARDEIATDLNADRLEDSGVYQLLVDQSVGRPGEGAAEWALLVGCYVFGAGEEDTVLLDKLAAVAHSAGAPLVAGADPSIAGASSDDTTWRDPLPPEWERLRGSAHARSVGLVFPRLLLRLPYGERTNECELLPFEELATDVEPPHDSYLWGTGALAVALLLGEAVAETGGAARRGTSIAGLPLHVYKVAGEAIATPCAEVLLTERVVERLLSRGLMPLVWVRDTDVVVLPRLQSVAEPATPLAGRWSTATDVEDR